jgi:hypothetical protein
MPETTEWERVAFTVVVDLPKGITDEALDNILAAVQVQVDEPIVGHTEDGFNEIYCDANVLVSKVERIDEAGQRSLENVHAVRRRLIEWCSNLETNYRYQQKQGYSGETTSRTRARRNDFADTLALLQGQEVETVLESISALVDATGGGRS